MSRDPKAGSAKNEEPTPNDRMRPRQGIRTFVLLVAAMAVVILLVTSLSLLLIRQRLRSQVADDVSQDLGRSVMIFGNLQAERLRDLEHENALLAALPTLKALMTSGDDRTIQDGAVEFWQIGGTDLFALAAPDGRIVAAYTKSPSSDVGIRQGLRALLASPDKQYIIDGGSLYSCSVRPLYFGSETNGTLLGYVINGDSLERTVRQISQPTGVEATFLSSGQVVASTLAPPLREEMAMQPQLLSGSVQAPETIKLGDARFLTAAEDLSAKATSPLQLVVLKSLEPAELSISRINRMVMSAALLALFSGAALMMILSRLVTRPLEELSKSVKAFGLGNSEYRIPRHGTQEVRQLSASFSAMRKQIRDANRALLEAERLATIGRMASSVSHDLRHYLAAIYANSEFLASDRFTAKERAEIFADIRAAVLGTTDMIESLLIFSRTGTSVRRTPELLATLVERAIAVVRAHPDAEGVTIAAHCGDPVETAVVVDGKQIERAVSNLLLNACQAIRTNGEASSVAITLEPQERYMIVNVVDNGTGVPERIRESLFEPFVSEGKQKGTGLGLTLAHCIALEHGGGVILLSSRPGETIFQMKLARAAGIQEATGAPGADRQNRVAENEDLRMRK